VAVVVLLGTCVDHRWSDDDVMLAQMRGTVLSRGGAAGVEDVVCRTIK
jgi:hypothetical protein